ncbi:chondroitinase-B domain-containing protein [Myxococcota bacterium]
MSRWLLLFVTCSALACCQGRIETGSRGFGDLGRDTGDNGGDAHDTGDGVDNGGDAHDTGDSVDNGNADDTGCVGNEIIVGTPVSADAINAAILTATPGDCVVIPDGTYDLSGDIGGQILIPAGLNGASENEIALTAATPGGVVFTGRPPVDDGYLIIVDSEYWIVREFQFIDVTYDSADSLLYNCTCIDINASHVRVTNNYFEGWAKDSRTSSRNNWVIWTGGDPAVDHTEIDHNTFYDSKAFCISNTGGSTRAINTHVHHNHFKDLWSGDDGNGGGLVGQMGGDFGENIPINCVWERNYSEISAAYDRPAGEDWQLDPTIKSSGCVIRNNVSINNSGENHRYAFEGNRGGSNTLFDSNFYVNGGGNHRFYGSGLRIVNNYWENPEWGVNIGEMGGCYSQIRNLLFANNTISKASVRGLLIGWPDNPPAWDSGTTYNRCDGVTYEGEEYQWKVSTPGSGIVPTDTDYWLLVEPPDNITITNNIIQGNPSSPSYGLVSDYGHTNGSYTNNILHDEGANGREWYFNNNGINSGIPEPGSFTNAEGKNNPNLVFRHGYWGLQASSGNAIGKAAVNVNATTDIDGDVRDSAHPDIGADEYSTASPSITIQEIIDGAGHRF